MIWIILGLLGVPLWLILGGLGASLWSRRKFQHEPGVFPCKVRGGADAEGQGKWPRTTSHARWVHDVLLVHSGLALIRFRALPVAGVEGEPVPAEGVKLKGGKPVSMRLHLDDDSMVEVAAPDSAAALLYGPFTAVPSRTARQIAS